MSQKLITSNGSSQNLQQTRVTGNDKHLVEITFKTADFQPFLVSIAL